MDNIVDQLYRDEGTSLKPYRDTVGKLTIGVGRNLDAEGIFPDEQALMLKNDILRHAKALIAHIPWVGKLDDIRYAVLLNMTFNMGIDGLLKFTTTLGFIRAGQYSLAARAMLQSHWAEQVGDRAKRLSKQMETGQWQ